LAGSSNSEVWYERELGEKIGRIETKLDALNEKLDAHIALDSGPLSGRTLKIVALIALTLFGVFELLSAEYVGQLIRLIGSHQSTSFAEWGAPREEHQGGWSVDGRSVYK
jgi:hypothetical protein